MIDQPQVVVGINEGMTTLAVGIVDDVIKQNHRAQALTVLRAEGKVVIFRVVFDK